MFSDSHRHTHMDESAASGVCMYMYVCVCVYLFVCMCVYM